MTDPVDDARTESIEVPGDAEDRYAALNDAVLAPVDGDGRRGRRSEEPGTTGRIRAGGRVSRGRAQGRGIRPREPVAGDRRARRDARPPWARRRAGSGEGIRRLAGGRRRATSGSCQRRQQPGPGAPAAAGGCPGRRDRRLHRRLPGGLGDVRLQRGAALGASAARLASSRPRPSGCSARRAACGSTTSRTRAVAGRAELWRAPVSRHPWRCLRDLLTRRRWPEDERLPLRGLAPIARRLIATADRHVHVHFASPAATHALRAGRLAGVPVSIAAHGYDIYAKPNGLARSSRRPSSSPPPASTRAATCRRPSTAIARKGAHGDHGRRRRALPPPDPASGRAHGGRDRSLRREEGLRPPDRGGGDPRSRRRASGS